MGRRKVVAGARRAQPGPLSQIPPDEPMPALFTGYIQYLFAEENKDSDRRPAKRRKTEAEVESVTIIREQLVISRPNSEASTDTKSFRIHDIQAHLKFRLGDSEPGAKPFHNYLLAISTRSTSKPESFCVAFPLKAKDVSNRLATVLEARDVSWSNPGTEDSIWIAADAHLDSHADSTALKLDFSVKWNVSTTVYPMSLSPYQRNFRKGILALAFPGKFDFTPGAHGSSCSPQLFYDAAHVPDPDNTPPEDLSVPHLTAKLYPFQRRAVQWMLQREGVQWRRSQDDSDSDVRDIGFERFEGPSSFTPIHDADGRICYLSRLLGKVTRDPLQFKLLGQNTKGGILSEEMGLGKTVELLALCLLHRRPAGPAEIFDSYLGEQVKATPATLIVAPASLRKQWLSELNKHAPGLRVMLYTGLNQDAREEQSNETALIEKLASQDVVVTTYNILTSELDYALGEPDRARRQPRKYHRPRSPLTQLSWWRVCLDEAQMIESGVSKAATLARLLPRVNAWGVTGTPVKDSVEDLRGLLLFLRYEPFASNIQAWNALINSDFEGFQRLFNHLALRHSKRLVRHEIFIPAQKRYVITMPFTAVEEQHYQSLFKEVTEACGLNTNGDPMRDDWDPEDPGVLEKMRTALDRLRQTALHPEVGQRNRKALGRRNGPMRTVAEVLDVMIEQSEVSMRADQRALLFAKLTRGQLLENSPQVKTALEIWQEVSKVATSIVEDCRQNLQHEIQQARANTNDRENAAAEVESEDEADEIDAGRVGDARRRLRSALEVQHKAVFFCANAHFQIKSNEDMTKPGSDDFHRLEKLEVDGYDSAKKIRREILDDIRRKALKLMAKIANAASKQSFAVIPEFKSIGSQGIESRTMFEAFEELSGLLNEQADKLDDWREHILQLLLKQLVDEDDENEITGDEYEDSTKLMEEIVVYIQILRTAIADREDAMSGQTNELVKHEARIAGELAREGDGPYPEKLLELFTERNNVKPPRHLRSLRAIVSDLRALSVKLRHDAANGSSRARLELEIVSEQLRATQRQLVEQQKVAQAMNQELDLFTATMNARVEFYRQLQYLSDMVAPYEGPTGDNVMNRLLAEEETLATKLDASQAKHRYLLHLKDMDAKDGEQRMCIICRENFTIGVLTICGHQFCKECITLWFKANHNCPVCKKRLHNSSLHDITLKPQELRIHSDSTETSQKKLAEGRIRGSPTTPKKSAIYTEFSEVKLAEIRNIDLDGPAFTTKVDNLVRHLLWLRDSDPGAKSIIFSQYADFLNVLRLAFKRYRIGFTSFDKANGATEFKEDPSIECFLLHARAHASGLNLVNASHVFLCEPLINTALELQAIARVHRIGQEQETTVWLYIVDGTVEESIYNLSVRRRMDHMGDHARARARDKGKSKESTPELADEAIEAANSMELEHASLSKLMGKGRAAGEAVDKGDLWECLFGHIVQGRRASREGALSNPGPAIRGLLAAEAAERRREEGDDGEGPLRLVNGL
ncbi:hypothetical protein VSDG_01658 [Cytospora chrysosperma]|uniref:RING-type domain-containing protein n=1 Tax=Cytospora chrysosperma TaxID=252740 RepID=A0A423WHM1_CYTCH|nr:hypothetical protein VSDG_01658 [Valsa sordida]